MSDMGGTDMESRRGRSACGRPMSLSASLHTPRHPGPHPWLGIPRLHLLPSLLRPCPLSPVVYPRQQTLQWRDASKGYSGAAADLLPLAEEQKHQHGGLIPVLLMCRGGGKYAEQGLLEKHDPKVLSISAEDSEYGPCIRRDVPFQRSKSGGAIDEPSPHRRLRSRFPAVLPTPTPSFSPCPRRRPKSDTRREALEREGRGNGCIPAASVGRSPLARCGLGYGLGAVQ
ncbi:hypothetical protein B0H14DRAFT_1430961 [Mycena olivaceomarginata]|nr:hypothetical protein B0H14DRAFT_1430961 [Mycena olivaceomarginata]